MPRQRKRARTAESGELHPDGLAVWARRFVTQLGVKGYSRSTLMMAESYLGIFVDWAAERGISEPREVTKPILERYQRHLFYFRKPNGKPLTFAVQHNRLQRLRGFFRYLARQNVILSNPASDLELPRAERRLPRAVFSEREVERVLSVPDTSDPLGLRDRAMMEVLYSTGLRRGELAALQLFELDRERGLLTVRQGKGRTDRVVPIGERALAWTERYLDEVRGALVVPPDDAILFLGDRGERFELGLLTRKMKRYIDAAALGKTGACHVFRHTMATLMLEGGADVRLIQEMLGHRKLETTQLYTRVSIKHLKAVHDATHPGAKLARRARAAAEPPAPEPPPTQDELFAALEREASEEDAGDATE